MLSTLEIVAAFQRKLSILKYFKNLKLSLKGPILYQTSLLSQLKGEFFLNMLSYYLKWHINKNLEKMFKNHAEENKRNWNFYEVVERLKSIRIQHVYQPLVENSHFK